MMIDDDTLKQLLRINDELLQLCKWLNEKRDIHQVDQLRAKLCRQTIARDRPRIFVFSQTDELRVSEMTVRCPLGKLDLHL
jgi:hypothetical protein